MFLFVQAKGDLDRLSYSGDLCAKIKSLPGLVRLHNRDTLIITDLPFIESGNGLTVWILGHLSYPSGKDMMDAFKEQNWARFGSRFTYRVQTGKWVLETDPVGAFAPNYLALADSILLADGNGILKSLAPVECKENPEWLADILLSGYPHDNVNILSPIVRCPAGTTVKGQAGVIQESSEVAFPKRFNGPLEPKAAVEASQRELDSCLSSLPVDGVGIHLTGGYDSRLILASLLRLGIKPRTFIFGVKTNYNSQIAERVARALNLEHHFIGLGGEFDERFPEIFEEATVLSEGLTSPSHTHYLYATKAISRECNYLIAGVGGGELHRGLLDENVSLPRVLGNIVKHGEKADTANTKGHVAFGLFPDLKELLWNRIESLTRAWKQEWREGKLADILLRNIFGGYFHSIIKIENCCLPSVYPYLDPRMIGVLSQSPFGLIYSPHMHAGPIFKLKSQLHLVKKYRPGPDALMSIPTDKGFSPSYLLNKWKWPLIPFNVYLSRRRRADMKELSYSKWLNMLLSKYSHKLFNSLPEIDQTAFKRHFKKPWNQSDTLMLSRILHIAKAREYIKKDASAS